MSNFVGFLFSLSVLLPFTIGLLRFTKIHESFRPFLFLIGLAALTELISFISIRIFRTNAVVSNIYCLAECLLILYQFYRWRFHVRPRKWYWIIPILCVLIWLLENLVYFKIMEFGPAFRVSYAFIVVMLSINEINYLITHENRALFRNARFLICIGFIIYFLYQILLEGALYISATEDNPVISNKIISIVVYINVLVNIIYAIAMWFIPENMSDFRRTMEKLEKQNREAV